MASGSDGAVAARGDAGSQWRCVVTYSTPRNTLTDTCRCGAAFDIYINYGTNAMTYQHDKWLAAHAVCRDADDLDEFMLEQFKDPAFVAAYHRAVAARAVNEASP